MPSRVGTDLETYGLEMVFQARGRPSQDRAMEVGRPRAIGRRPNRDPRTGVFEVRCHRIEILCRLGTEQVPHASRRSSVDFEPEWVQRGPDEGWDSTGLLNRRGQEQFAVDTVGHATPSVVSGR